jgi:hypothetical protein
MVSISAQLAANRFEADFIRFTHRKRCEAGGMPASSLPVLSALTNRENLLLNPNADGGLSSARLAATPKTVADTIAGRAEMQCNFYK